MYVMLKSGRLGSGLSEGDQKSGIELGARKALYQLNWNSCGELVQDRIILNRGMKIICLSQHNQNFFCAWFRLFFLFVLCSQMYSSPSPLGAIFTVNTFFIFYLLFMFGMRIIFFSLCFTLISYFTITNTVVIYPYFPSHYLFNTTSLLRSPLSHQF